MAKRGRRRRPDAAPSGPGGSAGPRDGRRSGRLALVAVLAATALVYSLSLAAPFYLDDYRNIVHNPLLGELSWFAHPWDVAASGAHHFHQHAIQTRWVGYLSLALGLKLHGLDPAAFRVGNLVIHLAATLLVFLGVRRLLARPALAGGSLEGRRGGVALLVAALFALHPVQSQPVIYVVQRLALLAGLFCLLAFWAWLRAVDAPSRGRTIAFSALAAGALGLALFSKQSAASFSLVLLAADAAFVERGWRRRALWFAGPAVALAAAVGVQVVRVASTQGTERLLAKAFSIADGASPLAYLATECRVVVRYLALLVWPRGLTLEHQVRWSTSLLEPAVVASGLLLLALLAGSTWLLFGRRESEPAGRLAGFGGLWFFVSLAIESSLLPIPDPMFEHRLYLPSVGFFLAAAAGWARLSSAWGPVARRATVGAVLVALAVTTASRARVWADEPRFWADLVAKAPESARVAYNAGVFEMRSRRLERAKELFERAIGIEPGHADALVALAQVATLRRDGEGAIRLYERALMARPDNWRVRLDLRTLWLARGETAEADRLWREAVAIAGVDEVVELLRSTGSEREIPRDARDLPSPPAAEVGGPQPP